MTPKEILTEADHCVKCGLCLPNCPTYRISRDEGESPRGRVTLIQALASGAQPAGERLQRHLATCLLCRACESACPSGVRYGVLIDAARRQLFVEGAARPDPVTRLVSRHARSRWSYPLARLYRNGGLNRIGDHFPNARIRRLSGLAPEIRDPLPAPATFYPADGERRGRVGLFIGCVGSVAERPALHGAIKVLTRIGFDVSLPAAQGCCGALDYHAGDHEAAARLAQANLAAFGGMELDALLTLSSGCGVHLADYASLGTPLAAKVWDASQFLCSTPWPAGLALEPLRGTVGLHTPCSLKHGLRQGGGAAELLSRVPGLRVEPLEGLACCGAAGDQMLTRPEIADAVREPLLERAAELAPDVVVSSNIGCALHIAAGLRTRGLQPLVRHPVELIADQLARD